MPCTSRSDVVANQKTEFKLLYRGCDAMPWCIVVKFSPQGVLRAELAGMPRSCRKLTLGYMLDLGIVLHGITGESRCAGQIKRGCRPY